MSPAWRASLRLARRDLRRHPVRAALTAALVALPVLLATVLALTEHNSSWSPEAQAGQLMGQADGLAQTTTYREVRARDALYGVPQPVRRGPDADRDRTALEEDALAAQLPEGSRLVPAPARGYEELESGGFATIVAVADDPLSEGLVDLRSGRLPQDGSEVALERAVADELGLLAEDGDPRADAAVTLADGRSLDVVGLIGNDRESGLVLATGPGFDVGREQMDAVARYLVDLPGGATVDRDLVERLAALGVALQPRTALTDPTRWGLDDEGGSEVETVVLGAVVVLVGLLEVALLVGASFAVAARRQARDLGLVAANGGTGRDLRRQMLAQGLVLGVAASVLATAAGVAVYFWGARWVADLMGWQLYTREVTWPAIVVIAVLGSLSALVAALLPARAVARLTPMQALAGSFPVSTTPPRDRTKALVVAACGLVMLAGGGWLTSRWFAAGGEEQALGPAVSALGLVVLVVGLVWASAYVVHLVSRLGGRLPLSGRFAFRAAGRHRGRTAAAMTGVMMTVALAVMAGFGFASVSRDIAGPEGSPEHAVEIEGEYAGLDAARVEPTLERVLGPADLLVTQTVGRRGERGYGPTLGKGRGGWPEVRQVDRAVLDRLAGGALGADAVRTFEQGGIVVLTDASWGRRPDTWEVRLGDRGDARRWELPVAYAEETLDPNLYLGEAFVSASTVEQLGLSATTASVVAQAERAITGEDLDRLQAYGLQAYSDEPGAVLADRLQWAGVGVAGLLALLVVGASVALAAAEGRDEAATLSAVGAGPMRHRAIGAMHGLFIGLAGTVTGVLVGLSGGAAFLQLDGRDGTAIPWVGLVGTAVVVLAASPVAGWLVTPHRLRMTRRTA